MSETIFFSELLPPDECGKVIEETGMGIELIRPSVGMNLDRFDEMIREIRADLKSWGRPDVSVHGPFQDLNPMSYERLVQDATRYRYEQAYEAAMLLDAKKLILHSGMLAETAYLEGWAERISDFWNQFMDGKTGITVCMENVYDPEIYPFEEVAGKVESEWFGICLDLGHANCYSKHTPQEWAARIAPYIRHLHVHDNSGERDAHLAIGSGDIDLDRVIEETGRDIPVTIENWRLEDVLSSYKRVREEITGE